MNQYQFSQICKKNKPKENHLKNILIAFISGGILACIAQGVSSLLLFELNFETQIDETGRERRYCKAKLDEKHLENCRKEGFSLQNIDIPPERLHMASPNGRFCAAKRTRSGLAGHHDRMTLCRERLFT